MPIREIDQPVFLELRMQCDLHQPRQLPFRVHRGHTRDGRRVEHAVADHAQLPVAFGHEHVTAGQKREAPGMVEPAGDDRHPDVGLLGGMENERLNR